MPAKNSRKSSVGNPTVSEVSGGGDSAGGGALFQGGVWNGGVPQSLSALHSINQPSVVHESGQQKAMYPYQRLVGMTRGINGRANYAALIAGKIRLVITRGSLWLLYHHIFLL